MDAALEEARDHLIDPLALAGLLGELPDAPFERQARAYQAIRASGAHMEDRLVRELVRVGRGPGKGRALGGAMGIDFRNHPMNDPWEIDPELFEDATIKHVWQSETQDYRGFGQRQAGFDLPHRGLLAEIEVIFAGTYTRTDGTGTHTVTDYSPYGLIEELALGVNSQVIKSAQGIAFEWRRQVVTRKGVAVPDSSPTAAGANVWDVRHRVPVADNMRNLWGAIYAQADDLNLKLDIMNAPLAKIATLTGNAAVTLTGTYQLVYTVFDAPWVEIKGRGLVIVLPDTDVIHRFHEFSEPVVSSGEKKFDLQRSAGEVERVYLWLDNGASTLMDPASWDEVRFAYLETEEPMRWPAKSLLAENARNYTNRITPKVAVIDLAAQNQRRDGLFPKAVVAPQIRVKIPSTVTVNAGARLHAVQEMLVGGA